jgi:hypothetical protein
VLRLVVDPHDDVEHPQRRHRRADVRETVTARLFVSEATVKTHVNHLLAKTGCRDRVALVGYAYRTGRITS